MSDDQVDIVEGHAGSVQDRPSCLGHQSYRLAEESTPVHPGQLEIVGQILFCDIGPGLEAHPGNPDQLE